MKIARYDRASGPNPINPDRMTAHDRRTELYGLLAAAVVRLVQRDHHDKFTESRDSSLHFRPEQSGTAGPTQRRSA